MRIHFGSGCRQCFPGEDAIVIGPCGGDRTNGLRDIDCAVRPETGGEDERSIHATGDWAARADPRRRARSSETCADEDPGDGRLMCVALNDIAPVWISN